jgi:16S rRNA (cytidine1402-2'-O)-methyltransferase
MEKEKNKIESGTLYLVGTPIGNLADLSERAKKVLAGVDFIAAEDTRNSLRLLSACDISAKLVSYHEHNKVVAGQKILERLLMGESCALITDAGMPAISDPGEDLVRLMAENDVPVHTVPGPSAVVTALALSALPTRRFAFEGFLDAKKSARRAQIEKIKNDDRTIVFYEAPHKLCATLADLSDILGGERKIAVCRELTKINEEALRFSLSDAVSYFEFNEPRGEFVLVVEGVGENFCQEKTNEFKDLSPNDHVKSWEEKGLSHMDAIKAAAKERGMKKSDFYKLLTNENK